MKAPTAFSLVVLVVLTAVPKIHCAPACASCEKTQSCLIQHLLDIINKIVKCHCLESLQAGAVTGATSQLTATSTEIPTTRGSEVVPNTTGGVKENKLIEPTTPAVFVTSTIAVDSQTTEGTSTTFQPTTTKLQGTTLAPTSTKVEGTTSAPTTTSLDSSVPTTVAAASTTSVPEIKEVTTNLPTPSTVDSLIVAATSSSAGEQSQCPCGNLETPEVLYIPVIQVDDKSTPFDLKKFLQCLFLPKV